MKKFFLTFLVIVSIIIIIWINKINFVDGIEHYHNVLYKLMAVLDLYLFVICIQLGMRKYKYIDLNIYLILAGFTYYTSYIYFLRTIDFTASVSLSYAINPFFYFALFVIAILIKKKKI